MQSRSHLRGGLAGFLLLPANNLLVFVLSPVILPTELTNVLEAASFARVLCLEAASFLLSLVKAGTDLDSVLVSFLLRFDATIGGRLGAGDSGRGHGEVSRVHGLTQLSPGQSSPLEVSHDFVIIISGDCPSVGLEVISLGVQSSGLHYIQEMIHACRVLVLGHYNLPLPGCQQVRDKAIAEHVQVDVSRFAFSGIGDFTIFSVICGSAQLTS